MNVNHHYQLLPVIISTAIVAILVLTDPEFPHWYLLIPLFGGPSITGALHIHNYNNREINIEYEKIRAQERDAASERRHVTFRHMISAWSKFWSLN